MNNILCTTSSFGQNAPQILKELETKGFHAILNPFSRKLTEEELLSLLNKYKPIGLLAGTEPITRSALEEANAYLKVISRVGVGWDDVDREAAEELGIKVFRTEGVLNQAVAELTLGLILSALRNICLHDRLIREGVWQKRMGSLLEDKTVGVIGFGSIGKRVGELVHAFGAKVVFCDPVPVEVSWAKPLSISELFSCADILTLNTSGSNCILGKEEIKLCKPGLIVVNTARGELVDENALHEALEKGRILYACLDVFADEPYTGPLAQLDNVIMTPHVGSYAMEARVKMEKKAVGNLLQGLKE